MQSVPVAISSTDPGEPWQESHFIYSFILALSQAVSHFNLRQPTRVSLLLAADRESSELLVFDPQSFLSERRNQIIEHYTGDAWRTNSNTLSLASVTNKIMMDGRGYYAHWFVEEPFGDSSDLTVAWIAEASSFLFSQLPVADNREWSSILIQAFDNRGLQILDYHLKRFITEENNKIPFSILEMLAELSSLKEEGESAEGNIVVGGASNVDQFVEVRLREQLLPTAKYVRKLLTAVAETPQSLILSTNSVLGFGTVEELPSDCLRIQFSSHGCQIFFQNSFRSLEELVAIRHGHVVRFAKLPHLELVSSAIRQKFPDADANRIVLAIEGIIEKAQANRFGCTLALFEANDDNQIPGRYLEGPLNFETSAALLAGFAHVDGAIHINLRGEILAFGCLLDGKAAPELENPAKGARHNSAIRFTSERTNSLLVVVSEDGPVSLFLDGRSSIQGLMLPQVRSVPNPLGMEEWSR